MSVPENKTATPGAVQESDPLAAADGTETGLYMTERRYDTTSSAKPPNRLAEHTLVLENRALRDDMQNVLDRLPVPVRITDSATGRISYVNDAALQLFMCASSKAIVGLPAAGFLPGAKGGKNPREQFARLLSTQTALSEEIEYRAFDGKTFLARTTVCVVNYRGNKSVLEIITDLTGENEKQKMLMSITEKEREANQLKSHFLSNMSHEIRTPMNAIIGLTEIELSRTEPRATFEVYRKINKSAKNLLEIINDILDLSKIEANKIDLYPVVFELDELIDSAVTVIAPRLEGKEVELILDVSDRLPRLLVGDKIRVWQILKNCLDNAAKFTSKGHITLTVSEDINHSTEQDIFVTFKVSDTGIGMTRQQLDKIFLPYEQFYNEMQKRYTGTGLGMPISHQLCDLMGGIMDIESKPEAGTTITFSLPFKRVYDENEDAPDSGMSSAAGLLKYKNARVLICEDNEINQEVARGIMEVFGVESVVADNGRLGLEALALESANGPGFDLILMDLHMPVMDGYEAARLIRQNDKYRAIPIISLTADATTDVSSKCEAAGMNDYLAKPVELEHVAAILKKWLPDTKRQ